MALGSDTNSEYLTVSVIIPVYNDNDRLRLCLDALAKQSYPDNLIKVIVVDNGSDITPNFVTDICGFATLLVQPEGGSYNARNAGINNSKGEVLAFTDSDCIPGTDWVKNGVSAIQKSCDGIIGGPVDFFYKNLDKFTVCELWEKVFGFKQDVNIRRSHFSVTANMFCYKYLFNKIGMFDGELKSGGDSEWGRRAYSTGYQAEYFDNVIINHPARGEMKDLLAKRKRVIYGICDLAKSDMKYRRRMIFSFVKILPSFRHRFYPVFKFSDIGIIDKIRLSMLIVIMHYYDYMNRVYKINCLWQSAG